MSKTTHIALSVLIALLAGCTGSKKYFKAAEHLEKQGLLSDAAEYYFEALQRKPTNVDARIKLKDVGQKYISNLSSEFFRDYNTQETEAAISTFNKLKTFTRRASTLDVQFDYPKDYENDYEKAVETYCLKNYSLASILVSQKRYSQALTYIANIKMYNNNYKNASQLEIVAVCEPLYQTAINELENKNYSAALTSLSHITKKTENYKDSKELLNMANAQQTKSFILFEPQGTVDKMEKDLQDYLFTAFGQAALQKQGSIQIVNNTPFQNDNSNVDLYNSSNVDLIQAIRKATGVDYFYLFDISNRQEHNAAPTHTAYIGYIGIQVKQPNSIIPLTEYRPFDYNYGRAQHSISYDFKYKIVNAYTNQIVASQTENIVSSDAIEYQQFTRGFNGNINSVFPYNPQQTNILGQFNPRPWRDLFSARSTVKSLQDLMTDAYNQCTNAFTRSTLNMK